MPLELHYSGNATDTLILEQPLLSQLLGPDTSGGWVQVLEATYDPNRNLTTARFRARLPDWVLKHGQVAPNGLLYGPMELD